MTDTHTTRTVRGVCPHDCPDACGLISTVTDGGVTEGRVTGVRGDPEHPVTDGWLCVKVREYPERVHHPDRLLYPLRRTGAKGGKSAKGAGQFERISWDDALGEIAARWRSLIDEHGAESILPYSYSGTLGVVQSAVCETRFWNRLGASRLDRTICDVAARRAVEATLGARRGVPYHHVADSALVVAWGHNPVSTAPHFMPHLTAARRQGAKLVVIDPVRTRTAAQADLHIAPRPGTDGALALGVGHILVECELHEERWLRANTVGWPELRERLREWPPARAAAVAGVTVAEIEELAAWIGAAKPWLLKIADGLQRHRTGGQAVRAVLTLPALTGQYGVRGGGLAYSTGGWLQWDTAALEKWDECPPAHRTARSINMNRLGAALTGNPRDVGDIPIRSLYVFNSNPATIAPNSAAVMRGLERADLFTVVHELFLTDTARHADIVLPATSQLEHVDLHKGYGHTHLAYNAPAIAPLGECRSNWDVMRALAAAMGFDEPWLTDDADAVIDELVTATAASSLALAGISPERLRAGGALPLAIPDAAPFADLRFPTPSGKVELRCVALGEDGIDALPDGSHRPDDVGPPPGWNDPGEPLELITAAAHHYVSSSFANHERLTRLEGEPRIELHPEDAAARGIADGDVLDVGNARGTCRLTARVTTDVRRGVAASPKGVWGRRGVNWTTSDALADLAGQSTFHANRVYLRVRPGATKEQDEPPTEPRTQSEAGRVI